MQNSTAKQNSTAQHSHKAMPSHLSVLKGAHGAGIDVQIRIDLDAGDPQATTLQHPTDAGDGNALPEAGNDASRYDYVLHGWALGTRATRTARAGEYERRAQK